MGSCGANAHCAIWAFSGMLPRSYHPHLRMARAVIEYHLAHDPIDMSEGRESDDVRIMFAAPLAVIFQIDVESRQVTVATAWMFRYRN